MLDATTLVVDDGVERGAGQFEAVGGERGRAEIYDGWGAASDVDAQQLFESLGRDQQGALVCADDDAVEKPELGRQLWFDVGDVQPRSQWADPPVIQGCAEHDRVREVGDVHRVVGEDQVVQRRRTDGAVRRGAMSEQVAASAVDVQPGQSSYENAPERSTWTPAAVPRPSPPSGTKRVMFRCRRSPR